MTKEELIEKLESIGVPRNFYSLLNEEPKDMAENVELMPDGRYEVYYYERYEKSAISYFDNLEDAYQEIYDSWKIYFPKWELPTEGRPMLRKILRKLFGRK